MKPLNGKVVNLSIVVNESISFLTTVQKTSSVKLQPLKPKEDYRKHYENHLLEDNKNAFMSNLLTGSDTESVFF